jgi:hypothetical protein
MSVQVSSASRDYTTTIPCHEAQPVVELTCPVEDLR